MDCYRFRYEKLILLILDRDICFSFKIRPVEYLFLSCNILGALFIVNQLVLMVIVFIFRLILILVIILTVIF